jgi:hypothetical protein
MVRKQIIQQSETIQEEIPAEVVNKFDNDEQLVLEFINAGYDILQLQNSTIVHATKYDPIVTLDTGHVAGFYINNPNEEKYMDNSRQYQNRHNRFF